jgi:cell division protein FtsZ
MTINLSIPQEISDLKPRITVVGVGGAGGNAVNNMVRSNLVGCEFIACNTDAQALHLSAADRKIQLGQSTTRGLGAGSRPDVGRQAAEEAMDEIMEHLRGSNMVFITAGMGGGTGTGAAPVIARAARESGILTVGVITKPFHFEGTHRMRLAESGIEELQKFVDTLLIIPNQNLFRVANERTTFAEAFKMADDVLHAGVRGVTDLMVMPGLINLDFADIRAVMMEMGKAMMGTGEATGDKRAIDAAEAAISNPLLDDVSMRGARGVLINITGGLDMTLFEVDEAANRIREEVDPEANIIFGSTFDEKLEGKMRISVVATGIDAEISRMANEAVNAVQPAEPRRTGPVLAFPTAAATAPAATAPVPSVAPQPVAEPAAISNFTRVASGSASQAAEPTAADAPFIAPRPMTPASRSQGNLTESEPMSDARAKKQQEPARPQPAAPSLFRRMIGLQAAAPTPKAKTKATLDAMRTAQSAPPRATGTTQADRPQHGVTEEDYLDIPAFLRRQAN